VGAEGGRRLLVCVLAGAAWVMLGRRNRADLGFLQFLLSAQLGTKNMDLEIAHESYIEQYAIDTYFKYVYETLAHGSIVEDIDYHLHDKLLYHAGKLCIPRDGRVYVIRETHTSLISVHFGVGKTIAQLQHYCY
jgi:hypothetical protein